MTKKEKLHLAFNQAVMMGLLRKRQDLVEMMHINKATISQAFNDKNGYLTDSFLRRFNASLGNIFNEDWLLGNSDVMMNQGVDIEEAPTQTSPTPSSDILSLRAHNTRLVEQNKRLLEMLREKDKLIATLIEKVVNP